DDRVTTLGIGSDGVVVAQPSRALHPKRSAPDAALPRILGGTGRPLGDVSRHVERTPAGTPRGVAPHPGGRRPPIVALVDDPLACVPSPLEPRTTLGAARVDAPRLRRLLAPRKRPPLRPSTGRPHPLGLGGQGSAAPAAIRLRLRPGHAVDRMLRTNFAS